MVIALRGVILRRVRMLPSALDLMTNGNIDVAFFSQHFLAVMASGDQQ